MTAHLSALKVFVFCMVLSIIVILTVLSVTGCHTGRTDKPDNQIVVLTYNIHHAEGIDGKFDLPRIAEVIKSVSPDIVSLQEVDRKTERSSGIDQAEELARLTGMNLAYGPAFDYQGGKYGNAVLTRSSIEKSVTYPLPGEPRVLLVVECKLSDDSESDQTFAFLATHLDTQEEPRRASVPLIEKHVQTLANKPALLAGDLNATPLSPTMKALGENWTIAGAGKQLLTSPVVKPDKQIDYILYRPSNRWKVIEVKVLSEQVASDHRPVMAVLEMLPAPETGF